MPPPLTRLLQVPGIEAKVLLPSASSAGGSTTGVSRRPRTLAIVGHPWSRLGGSWSDPVVRHLAAAFLSRGVPTVLLNSRGAGQTTRSPSWTGAKEKADYAEVLEAGLADVLGPDAQEGEVFVCGYSHGALLALAQEPVVRSFRVFKVLVSPPLSVRWFLTPGLSSTLVPPPSAPSLTGGREHALVLYGKSDVFTSAASVRAWIAESASDGVHVRAVEVDEGDHFWRAGEDPLGRLGREVGRWLDDGWAGRAPAVERGGNR